MLDRLEMRGVLSAETVGQLQSAYVFLRRLEHRLQYVEDAQTHKLPGSAEDIVALIDEETACVVVQSPDVFGLIRNALGL